MKIKKNTFYTLVLELFFPSTANCSKSKIQKNPKIEFPYYIVCTYGISHTPSFRILESVSFRDKHLRNELEHRGDTSDNSISGFSPEDTVCSYTVNPAAENVAHQQPFWFYLFRDKSLRNELEHRRNCWEFHFRIFTRVHSVLIHCKPGRS
jgi:hypothetical protein